ncbi:hypothetical protein MASR2M48_12810 [Spirochaetota bacterium]
MNREQSQNTEPRSAIVERSTNETSVKVELSLSSGVVKVDTGIGFLDHLFGALAFHGGMALAMTCRGDLEVDDHHSAEDCALAFGAALRQALGDKAGIRRFGTAFAPLDEALARAVVDLLGQALRRDRSGSCQTVHRGPCLRERGSHRDEYSQRIHVEHTPGCLAWQQ